ncbi:MAG: Ldh family oxidoreductase [Woeseiaceae bacterium]|nr:Ldh family oxidoreductase [Woeseiaceae bacterium]
METVRLDLDNAVDLVAQKLVASGTSESNAYSVAQALVAAEADGQAGHGLSRVASYAAQARSGKVDGRATPVVSRPALALLRIDANSGFAYPAVDLACEELPAVARKTGIAAACIHNSHHFGQAGAHAERLARQGLVALVFSNSPKAMSFWGGDKPMLGTNPIAMAAPLEGADPLVIDLALSRVARGKIAAAKRDGQRIPDNWALDADGRPTDDPAAALEGSMLPIGDAKGAALALVVELLAAALTGSNFGYEASSFFEGDGPPPHIGHTIIVFEPKIASGNGFAERMTNIMSAIDATKGARLPGVSRLSRRRQAETHGIEVSTTLYEEIVAGAQTGPDHA